MTTNIPSVSIILTVYQVEKYLPRCIESVINQSLKNIEIILIDDGSTDRSGYMCDVYAKVDSRIRVFHKKNEGISSCRQFGVECINGEYVIFCDSDDWIELNMLEDLYRVAKFQNADVVWSDMVFEYENQSVVSVQKPRSLEAKNIFLDLFYPINGSVCNKLIKSSLFQKWNVYFDENIKYAEDLFVMMQLYSNPIITSYVHKPLYHYDRYSNAQSLTHKDDARDMLDSIRIFDSVFEKKVRPLVKYKCAAMMRAYEQNLYTMNELYNLFPEAHSRILLEGFIFRDLAMIKLSLSFYNLKWLGETLEHVINGARKIKHIIQDPQK